MIEAFFECKQISGISDVPLVSQYANTRLSELASQGIPYKLSVFGLDDYSVLYIIEVVEDSNSFKRNLNEIESPCSWAFNKF